MISGDYSIRIRPVDNGFTVETPDMDKIKKKEAERSKRKGDHDYPTYIGDCTKSAIAKTVPEVLKLIKASLAELPEPDMEYAQAFAEAAAEMKG